MKYNSLYPLIYRTKEFNKVVDELNDSIKDKNIKKLKSINNEKPYAILLEDFHIQKDKYKKITGDKFADFYLVKYKDFQEDFKEDFKEDFQKYLIDNKENIKLFQFNSDFKQVSESQQVVLNIINVKGDIINYDSCPEGNPYSNIIGLDSCLNNKIVINPLFFNNLN